MVVEELLAVMLTLGVVLEDTLTLEVPDLVRVAVAQPVGLRVALPQWEMVPLPVMEGVEEVEREPDTVTVPLTVPEAHRLLLRDVVAVSVAQGLAVGLPLAHTVSVGVRVGEAEPLPELLAISVKVRVSVTRLELDALMQAVSEVLPLREGVALEQELAAGVADTVLEAVGQGEADCVAQPVEEREGEGEVERESVPEGEREGEGVEDWHTLAVEVTVVEGVVVGERVGESVEVLHRVGDVELVEQGLTVMLVERLGTAVTLGVTLREEVEERDFDTELVSVALGVVDTENVAEGVARALLLPCSDAEGQRVTVTDTVGDSVPVTEVESVTVTVPH